MKIIHLNMLIEFANKNGFNYSSPKENDDSIYIKEIKSKNATIAVKAIECGNIQILKFLVDYFDLDLTKKIDNKESLFLRAFRQELNKEKPNNNLLSYLMLNCNPAKPLKEIYETTKMDFGISNNINYYDIDYNFSPSSLSFLQPVDTPLSIKIWSLNENKAEKPKYYEIYSRQELFNNILVGTCIISLIASMVASIPAIMIFNSEALFFILFLGIPLAICANALVETNTQTLSHFLTKLSYRDLIKEQNHNYSITI